MAKAVSQEEQDVYMQAQRNYVAITRGECNEETLRQFAKSDDSRAYKIAYHALMSLIKQN